MNSTRTNPSTFPQIAVVVALLVALALFAGALIRGGGTLSLPSAGDQASLPSSVVRQFSASNAEGMAIYHQSERGPLGAASSEAEGLNIYFESERGIPVDLATKEAGLAIYHQSEWGTAAVGATSSNEAGLAISTPDTPSPEFRSGS